LPVALVVVAAVAVAVIVGSGGSKRRGGPGPVRSAGVLESLRIYLARGSRTGTETVQGVIYADSHGSPGALLEVSNPRLFHGTEPASWYELTFASPLRLAAGGTYWIGVTTGGEGGVAGFRWDPVAGIRRWVLDPAPATFPTAFTQDNEEMSLYAAYTPAGRSGQSTFGKSTIGACSDVLGAPETRVLPYALPAAGSSSSPSSSAPGTTPSQPIGACRPHRVKHG
jgi:hypothetical protein